jgi:thiamine-monophosphate kinase
VADLAKLCRVSDVAADVRAVQVPLSAAAAQALAVDPRLIEQALTGGEDYEILCTVAPDRIAAFQADAAKAGVAVTEIGRIAAGPPVPRFFDRGGDLLAFAHPGHSHF